MVISKKTIIFQGFRESPTYSRGGGGQMLISIETHITCDFSRGCPDPLYPPLDPHMYADINCPWHTYPQRFIYNFGLMGPGTLLFPIPMSPNCKLMSPEHFFS